MVQIGRLNKLTVKTIQAYGVHLDGGEAGDILLPTRDVPGKCQSGDELEVFVFPDRENALRATTRIPNALVGQFARLQVVACSPSGAYLDWGMGMDLFVPKSEQLDSMREGGTYVVFVFLSKRNGKIVASSKLRSFFSSQPPDYEEGEEADLLIYEKTNMGFRAVVNQSHEGMIYTNEIFQKLLIGQQLRGYIKRIREDFKIDLCLQQPGYKKIEDISQTILHTIKEHGGRIGLTDKSPPEDIYLLFE